MSRIPDHPTDPRPAVLSATVACLAAFGAAIVGSTGPVQRAPLLLAGIGSGLYACGIVLRRRRYRFVGRGATIVGPLVVGGALVGIIALSPPLPTMLPVIACGLGVAFLTAGLFPIVVRWARQCAVFGVVLLLGGVLANVVIAAPSIWRSATAATLVVLSWDAADRAVSVGRELGAGATTAPVEVVRTVPSVLVGGMAVVLTVGASRIPTAGGTVFGVLLVLVATVAFTLVLSHIPHTSES
ncbi:hypothetical protein C479_14503 [Halovivax asiaticus JCM 14624]|uniref:Uncharacterized protein n=1 Tax=Halovivax asiaticus JCM 14624 TaxID=1227490 RepID=M0BE43_9EURY|nr:hypothetical protein [Halovivax asiaticus]ELZ08558.1 hypothetical protein C479_14503 [Halovivax asiaticus JCM 14624]